MVATEPLMAEALTLFGAQGEPCRRGGTKTDRLDPLETSRTDEESTSILKTLLSPRDGKLAEAFDAETTPPACSPKALARTERRLRDRVDAGNWSNRACSDPDFRSWGFPRTQPLYVHQETAIAKFLSGRNPW